MECYIFVATQNLKKRNATKIIIKKLPPKAGVFIYTKRTFSFSIPEFSHHQDTRQMSCNGQLHHLE